MKKSFPTFSSKEIVESYYTFSELKSKHFKHPYARKMKKKIYTIYTVF